MNELWLHQLLKFPVVLKRLLVSQWYLKYDVDYRRDSSEQRPNVQLPDLAVREDKGTVRGKNIDLKICTAKSLSHTLLGLSWAWELLQSIVSIPQLKLMPEDMNSYM